MCTQIIRSAGVIWCAQRPAGQLLTFYKMPYSSVNFKWDSVSCKYTKSALWNGCGPWSNTALWQFTCQLCSHPSKTWTAGCGAQDGFLCFVLFQPGQGEAGVRGRSLPGPTGSQMVPDPQGDSQGLCGARDQHRGLARPLPWPQPHSPELAPGAV